MSADGWFVIAAGNNKLCLSVCAVVGINELTQHPRCTTPGFRTHLQGEFKALLKPILLMQLVLHWVARLSEVGLARAPINGYNEAVQDPQTCLLELFQSITLPSGNVTCPVRLDGAPLPMREHGRHSRFVCVATLEAV